MSPAATIPAQVRTPGSVKWVRLRDRSVNPQQDDHTQNEPAIP
jgi:hypothetical protein